MVTRRCLCGGDGVHVQLRPPFSMLADYSAKEGPHFTTAIGIERRRRVLPLLSPSPTLFHNPLPP